MNDNNKGHTKQYSGTFEMIIQASVDRKETSKFTYVELFFVFVFLCTLLLLVGSEQNDQHEVTPTLKCIQLVYMLHLSAYASVCMYGLHNHNLCTSFPVMVMDGIGGWVGEVCEVDG